MAGFWDKVLGRDNGVKEVSVSRDEIVAKVQAKYQQTNAAAAESLQELMTFAQAMINVYATKKPNWHIDKSLGAIWVAVSGEDHSENYKLLGQAFARIRIQALRDAATNHKNPTAEEYVLLNRGILPPIAAGYLSQIVDIIDNVPAEQKFAVFSGLALNPKNTLIFAGAFPDDEGGTRYVWTDTTKDPSSAGLVSIVINGDKISPSICETADATFIVRHATGFDISVNTGPGEYSVQDIDGSAAKVIQTPVMLPYMRASSLIIRPADLSEHDRAQKAGGCVAGGCKKAEGCASIVHMEKVDEPGALRAAA